MAIHHAIVAKARNAGLEIKEIGEKFVLQNEAGQTSQEFDSAKDASDAIGTDALKFGRAPKANPNKNGVMGADYHKRYMEQGGGSGDLLDVALRSAVKGEKGVDPAKVRAIAEQNGVWSERWADLNPGMQRMNLANRLRGLLRNNAEAAVTLGDSEPSRFDIEFNPPARLVKKAGAAERKAEREAKAAAKKAEKEQAKAERKAAAEAKAAEKAKAKEAEAVKESEAAAEEAKDEKPKTVRVNRDAADKAKAAAKAAREAKKAK